MLWKHFLLFGALEYKIIPMYPYYPKGTPPMFEAEAFTLQFQQLGAMRFSRLRLAVLVPTGETGSSGVDKRCEEFIGMIAVIHSLTPH